LCTISLADFNTSIYSPSINIISRSLPYSSLTRLLFVSTIIFLPSPIPPTKYFGYGYSSYKNKKK